MFDGVDLVEITDDTPAYIEGVLTWDEEVRWNVAADATPSENCLELVMIIATNKLLDIDQLTVPSDKLLKMINANSDHNWDEADIESALKELLHIKVNRLEDGQKVDDFFVHL